MNGELQVTSYECSNTVAARGFELRRRPDELVALLAVYVQGWWLYAKAAKGDRHLRRGEGRFGRVQGARAARSGPESPAVEETVDPEVQFRATASRGGESKRSKTRRSDQCVPNLHSPFATAIILRIMTPKHYTSRS